jgi:hypothetical protein
VPEPSDADEPVPGEQAVLLVSTAVVPTDAAARYAKQLLAHLGRKAGVEALDGEPDGGRLTLSAGTGIVRPRADHLVMEAIAVDVEALAVVEDVLGRHLERFGARRELTVSWQRPAATPED